MSIIQCLVGDSNQRPKIGYVMAAHAARALSEDSAANIQQYTEYKLVAIESEYSDRILADAITRGCYPLFKTPNGGQSGAVHTQSHFPKEATPVSSANERFHRRKSVYSVHCPSRLLSPSGWIPQSTQYGVMHYATSNNYHNTRTRGSDNPLEQATQLCPNKLNEAFLDYWNPWSPIPIISQ
ncbi:uncharacterized protein EURHEDRAFT_399764 [Aspergillus ruber CBS 135680]|uniref:Uncharacterized protein n=1 Tax=Aspergillus ruber (strain CBS 135680) TaxID=1388766 RepID=A0A017SQD1_ASPRC|nr:uncharacterized protein EURHEDRAFT_399764 [Aspergillus ruber CBS 135680]EYE98475.1 hypothetical protein EURHEDRAFT_399764 [Aspergillus ruber CBS 135680]